MPESPKPANFAAPKVKVINPGGTLPNVLNVDLIMIQILHDAAASYQGVLNSLHATGMERELANLKLDWINRAIQITNLK